MAVHTIVTVGGTGNLPGTNELPVDMSKKRETSMAALTTLTTILSRLQNDKAHNFRVDLMEEYEMPWKVTIATTEDSASTPIYVTAYGTTLVQDTLLYNPRTDDLRIVTATPTTNTIAVTVSQGGTTSTVWKSGDEVFVLLPKIAETDETDRHTSMVDENIYNYVQICRLDFKMTLLQNAMTSHFGGPGEKRAQLRRQKYREFRIKEELLRWMGGRQLGTETAPDIRYGMGGIIHFLRNGTFHKDFGGILTETGLDNFIGDYHDENPDLTKIDAFMAPNVIRQINYMCKNKIRLSPDSKKYGLNLNQYIGGPLSVNLIPVPLWTDVTTKGWFFFLDLTRIRLKDIDNPTFYPWDRTPIAGELIKDGYRSVSSLLLANESAHAWAEGAQA